MRETSRKEFLNIPNYITLGRLAAVPILLILMLFTREKDGALTLSPAFSLAAGLVFVIAMTSDMVDGYYARKYNISSTFGKFFDPLADKLLFLTAMIMMIPLGRIPAWIVAIFFIREVTVTALRGIAVDRRIVIAASSWGKYKSVFVSVTCTGLLLHYPFVDIEWRLIGWLFMFPALAFSVGSGIHYAVGFTWALTQEAESLRGE